VPTPGNDCNDPFLVTVNAGSLPFMDENTTRGRGNDYDQTCLNGYDDGLDIVYKLSVPAGIAVSIVLDPKGAKYTGLLLSDACPSGGACVAKSFSPFGDAHGIGCIVLLSGEYYLMVDRGLRPDVIDSFTLTIAECYSPQGACCLGDECMGAMWHEECAELSGFWYEGETCQSLGACPALQGGEQCGNAIVVNVPGDLPFNNSYTTCGTGDDYSGCTCMDMYDSGEDMLFKLVVASPVTVNISLTGTPTLMAMALAADCPPMMECVSAAGMMNGITLEPGEYYLMVDMWGPPDCGSFTLRVKESP
jgi:hypothetical protein